SHRDRFGAEALQFLERGGRRHAAGRLQTHARERVHERGLAGIAAADNIPGAAATSHYIIYGRPAPPLDYVSCGVRLFDDQQFLVERVDNGAVDRWEAFLTEPLAGFENVAADQIETGFVLAPGLHMEPGEAPIGAVLGK